MDKIINFLCNIVQNRWKLLFFLWNKLAEDKIYIFDFAAGFFSELRIGAKTESWKARGP